MSQTHSFTRPTILAAIELLAEKLSQASFDQMILRVELEQEIPQGKEVSVKASRQGWRRWCSRVASR